MRGTGHVARQFEPDWFADTDLVLAADAGHASVLRRWARTKEDAAKVHLLREFDPAAVAAGTLEVDDPWYGDEEDFVRCFTEVEAACRGVASWVAGELTACAGTMAEPAVPRHGMAGQGSMALAMYGAIAAGLALAIGADAKLGIVALLTAVVIEMLVFFVAHAYVDVVG